jgi:UDP-N-acetylmuramoyl-tripeptide--D-alanyl-D-alanine ligase
MIVSFLFVVISIVWFVSAVFDYAYFTYYAQLKEYRIDRLRDFLSSQSGKDFLFDYRILWRIVTVVALYTLLRGTLPDVYIVSAVLLVEIVTKGYYVWKRNVRRPVFTSKAILLVVSGVVCELVLFSQVGLVNVLLFVMVFRFALLSGLVLLFAVPTMVSKLVYVHMAKQKLLKYPQLKVIGITGSYGKSSTKEFLAQILSAQHAVIKTPRNINTEIGIASFVLSANFENVDIFVVEMGAYKMGEIQKICDMVHPTIGILTAIAPQHLTLFGSMLNIQQAKYELLRSLPSNGLAVTNIDNEYCRELLPTLTCPTRTFGSDTELCPDVLITHIESGKDGVEFTTTVGGYPRQVVMPIIGKHNVWNVVAAAIVAKAVGMTNEAIDVRIRVLEQGQGSIKVQSYGKATILNDSYNSNPEGFKAALDLLNTFPSSKRRIVVTRGMLELGDMSDELHEQIGGEISFVADELIITEKDNALPLAKGIVHKYNTQVHHIYRWQELLIRVRQLRDQDVVILFENRVHSAIATEVGM